MNPEMVICETTVWADYHNTRNVYKKIRLMKKAQILNRYPFIDHYKTYAYKTKNQRGPAKEEQTFIISYAYNYDAFADEAQFIHELHEIGLLFFKEKGLYNGSDAYKIIVHEALCPIDSIKSHVHMYYNNTFQPISYHEGSKSTTHTCIALRGSERNALRTEMEHD